MVYDAFCFFNELDLLELRLNILDPYVDKFVICESTETFSGQSKPLYFKENEDRFDKWKDKIIHIVAPKFETDSAFERAAYQKDFIRTVLLAEPDDTIYYGDLDEIWKPQTEEGKLKQLNYCYYLNMRSSEEWQGTVVSKYKNLRNLNEMRADHSRILEDGGWHFTNMGGAEQVKKKLEAYDHQEFNQQSIKDNIEEKIANGQDYVGRRVDWQGKPFSFWVDEVDLPQYLLDNRKQYAIYFK